MIAKPYLIGTGIVVALAAFLVQPQNMPAQQMDELTAQQVDQEPAFTWTEEQAKKGKKLWQYKGCQGCHTIGKSGGAGPDLMDISARREPEWLMKWLTETSDMLDTDPIAMALLKEYNNTRMPDLKLKPEEADNLLHYIAQQSDKKRD